LLSIAAKEAGNAVRKLLGQGGGKEWSNVRGGVSAASDGVGGGMGIVVCKEEVVGMDDEL